MDQNGKYSKYLGSLLAATALLATMTVFAVSRLHLRGRAGDKLAHEDPSPKTPAPDTVITADAAPPGRNPVACPPLDVIAKRVNAAIFESGPAGAGVAPAGQSRIVRCVPGFFPAPGFFVIAAVDDRFEQLTLDVSSEKKPARAEPRVSTGSQVAHVETVDLDGDGSDEVLVEVDVDRRGIRQTILYVYRRSDAKLEEAFYLQTGLDNEGSLGDEETASRDLYVARYRIGEPAPDQSRALLVDGEVKRGKADPDWVIGHAEFHWKDGRMVR